MKRRIGNACWHAFHVQHALLCREAGFYEQEGIDVEIVHAKINPKAIQASPEVNGMTRWGQCCRPMSRR